jgi:hypothetical protein
MFKHTPIPAWRILMLIPELRLKDRTELKTLADQIVRGGGAIKRAVHRFEVDEATYLQIQTLVLLVGKMQALMDTLKEQLQKEPPQITLDLDPVTTNGHEMEVQI